MMWAINIFLDCKEKPLLMIGAQSLLESVKKDFGDKAIGYYENAEDKITQINFENVVYVEYTEFG